MEECKPSRSRPLLYRWRAPRERGGAFWVYFLVGTLCLVLWRLSAHRRLESVPASTPTSIPFASSFSWEDITPSESLEYHDCGGGFQCTLLEVPMDYNRTGTTRGRTFALAVVRIPAKVPIDDPRYGGAVLINPGKLYSHEPENCASNVTRWPRRPWNSASIPIRSQSADYHRLRE